MPLTRHRWPLIFLLGAVAVAVAWEIFPVEPDFKAAPGEGDNWRIPVVSMPAPARALERLGRASPWGRLAESGESPPLNPPDWHILAIFRRGSERAIVVRVGNQPEQRLKVGDRLPGGSTILEIRENSLCVLVNGVKRSLAIYPEGSAIL